MSTTIRSLPTALPANVGARWGSWTSFGWARLRLPSTSSPSGAGGAASQAQSRSDLHTRRLSDTDHQGERQMPRADLSKDLIHWIRAEGNDDAFEVLRSIVREQRLMGGDGHIRGGYRCVCFTEAPDSTFHQVIGRYRPFGIEVSKQWAYSEGGRPVIYQPEEEYEQLPESHRWRHVRYELDAEPPIDFSWEREWRIQTDELGLPPGEARIILPHEDWAEALEGEHFAEEEHRIDMFASVYGEEYRMLSLDPFVYSISIIDV